MVSMDHVSHYVANLRRIRCGSAVPNVYAEACTHFCASDIVDAMRCDLCVMQLMERGVDGCEKWFRWWWSLDAAFNGPIGLDREIQVRLCVHANLGGADHCGCCFISVISLLTS